jgi:hypothetical protein
VHHGGASGVYRRNLQLPAFARTSAGQRYCASGFGLVGGRTLGPAGACENDPRL